MLHAAPALVEFAHVVLRHHGVDDRVARDTAEVLVEGDLLGHTTHGLQLLPRYLAGVLGGALTRAGEPLTVADSGASFTWDGNYLPGPHLVRRAIAECLQRLGKAPVVTAVLRRSGHIGCLAVYALAVAEQGYVIMLCSSDPAVAPVAPHGATEGRLTPNPIAAGWPTDGDPVFLDVCPSTTTAGMVGRSARAGTALGGDWLIGVDGVPSSDPGIFQREGGGAILPLGGTDLGHKGFALALMVEALTMGLGGFGRADGVAQDGAAVWLQIIDPLGFGGEAAFRREAGWTATSCTEARPVPGGPAVRLPGARGLALKRRQLAEGVALHQDTINALVALAADTGLPFPASIAED